MRNLWSGKVVSSCATPVQQFTWTERDHREIDIDDDAAAVGNVRPIGGLPASNTNSTSNMSPLGKPDANAFAAPGTLLESGDGDNDDNVVVVVTTLEANGNAQQQQQLQHSPPSTAAATSALIRTSTGVGVTTTPATGRQITSAAGVIFIGTTANGSEVTSSSVCVFPNAATAARQQSPSAPPPTSHGQSAAADPPPPTIPPMPHDQQPQQQPTPAADAAVSATKLPQRTYSAISSHSEAGSIASAYDICRICHCEGSAEAPLISPCCCSGSLKFVHQKCLQQWIKSSQTRSCEVCRFTFIMETKVKPFRKWEKLDMSSVERRKILCSVTFHVVAITCVVWSLYVLIDRTAEEVRAGQLDWPFWTKLVVVAIGFTGGIVFMYVQCKMYFQLFRRWQSYNKVIYVQNGPASGIAGGGGGDSVQQCGGGGGCDGIGKYVAHSNGAAEANGCGLNK